MAKTEFEVVPGRQEIVMTRVFDAPRELVFNACADPKLFPRWWGPRRLSTEVKRMEVRPGGSWRMVQRDDDGHEFAFHGVYHDVVSPERMVQTFEFEGAPGHVQLDTTTLEQRGGKTLVRTVSAFPSVEDRDAMIASGMERGVRDSAERLEELLAKLQAS